MVALEHAASHGWREWGGWGGGGGGGGGEKRSIILNFFLLFEI